MSSLVSIKLQSPSLSAIDDYAFWGCTRLSSINVPSNVSSVGSYALSGCTRLKNVWMSNNVDTINIGTFKDCTSLTAFSNDGGSIQYVNASAFMNCTSLPGGAGPNYKSIGNYAYANCS